MTVDSHEHVSKAGVDAKGPPWVDPDLLGAYLELQVQWLKLQLTNARKEALDSQRDAEMAAANWRLARHGAKTAIIVALLAAGVGLVAVLTWPDLWRGLSTGTLGTLRLGPTQEAALGGVGAFMRFLRDWKDVLILVGGGGLLITLKRLAYRSVGSAFVIVLGVTLSASLLTGLLLGDVRLNLVNDNVVPVHVTWKGWVVLGLAIVAGLALMREVVDIAIEAGPAAFQAQPHWYDRVAEWIVWFISSTWPGRFVGWLVRPRRWKRLIAILGALGAISIVLCIGAVAAAIITNPNNSVWIAAALIAVPLGPLWWLWLIAALVISPAGRHPTEGTYSMAFFTYVPLLSLVAFVGATLSPYSYGTNGGPVGAALWIEVAALLIWIVWFVWAVVALPTSLRVAYLPLVVCFLLAGFMHYGYLAFYSLSAVLSAGVPIALRNWQVGRELTDATQPESLPVRPSGSVMQVPWTADQSSSSHTTV